ncbi:MAG: reductive dehalogenase [Bacteroidetes bacterium]|nr:reductive dehalogenase [Bacteroidota bacterium]
MINFFVLNQDLISFLFLLTGVAFTGMLIYVGVISIFEREYRAVRVSLILSMLILVVFLAIYLIDFPLKEVAEISILVFISLSLLILFIPFDSKRKHSYQIPTEKHDERNIMFSRNELKEGTEQYNNYYTSYPNHKDLDDKFRQKPGLLSPNASLYHPFAFASAHANLEVIERLKTQVNGPVKEKRTEVEASEITNYLKTWSKKLGAHSFGVTKLQNYHLYSHKGRGDLYGKPVENKQNYAIAITVEMDHEIMQTAPKSTVIMESTQQYLNSGTVAVQLASFIRELGYEARAHIDGNYEVICPLVARDAGLGEIGRMGLLMTPKLGPRVRIAVITTDIPLQIEKRKNHSSVIDFCEICKKCADICPSRSIPFEKRRAEIEGVLRWKINSESCFTYWCTVGTDCGRCMAVCPYAHSNNTMHNFIRWGIHNSYIFRRFALLMDDLFYGRKPKSRKLPSWIDN